MIFLAYLEKTFLESLREWRVLSLVLILAPAFVYMMNGYFAAAAPAYQLLVANHDLVGPSRSNPSAEADGLIRAWKEAKHPDGQPMFSLVEVSDLDAAQSKVRSRDADLLVEIPAGFARTLSRYRDQKGGAAATLVNHADDKNLRGAMAMALSDYLAFAYAAEITAATVPLDISVQSMGGTRARGEFDFYLPALLVLAIITTLFTAATSLIREIDKGTMTRLQLSRLTTGQLVAAVAVNQVPLGLAALGLAYLAAVSCGYRSEGSLGVLLVVGAATTLSVMAFAVLTASFLRSMFALLTVGTFPFFVLMFFSECMFPLPKIKALEIGGNVLYANDVLPTALCVRAFNKILNYGSDLGGVGFELGVILALTIAYAAPGVWLFRYRHQRV